MVRGRTFILAIAVALLNAGGTALAQQADLSVTKSGPDTATAGSNVAYFVDLTNFGPDDSTTVTLLDRMPAGMTFVSATPGPGAGAFSCTGPGIGVFGNVSCTAPVLVSGTTASFTFVFQIDPSAADGTAFTNVATGSSADVQDPNGENDQGVATTFIPGPPPADVSVNKTATPNAPPGGNVTFTITLTNIGPGSAVNETLSDRMPGDMTFVSFTENGGPPVDCTAPAVGTANGTINCSWANLPVGTTTFVLVGQVPPATAAGTTYSNTANTSASNDFTSENDSSTATVTVSDADAAILKTGPASAVAGSNVTYAITITNNGPDTTDLGFSDPLPPGTVFVSLAQSSGPAAACVTPPPGTNGTVTCTASTVLGGTSAQFTLVIAVGGAVSSISNTATVTSSAFDPNPANDSSMATTTITPSADIAITKTGPASAVSGTNVNYALTIVNNGPSDAQTVAVTDAVPANATFVSMTQTAGLAFNCVNPAVGATGTVSCTLATLPIGGSAAFTLVVKANAAATGSITNIANGSTTTADPTPGNNSATATTPLVPSSDVAVTKTAPASVQAGSNISYAINVTNNGPSDAQTVVLTDAVPANTTFVSMTQNSGPSFACVPLAVGATGTESCSLATLASGASAGFTMVVKMNPAAPAGTVVTNTASVTRTTPDSNAANDTATATTSVLTPDLAIAKTGLIGPAINQIQYTITLSNIGTGDAISPSFADTVPGNTTYASLTQTSGPAFTCVTPAAGSTGTVSCSAATLVAGSSAAFTIGVTITAGTPAGTSITNTATATSVPADANPANNTATATTVAPAGIPTLSPTLLALLGVALAFAAAVALKR